MSSIAKVVTLLVLLVQSFFALGDSIIGISDDGREVKIDEDGSWHYTSEDRFATTTSGQRVRLSTDGSWQFVESNELPSMAMRQQNGFSRDRIKTNSLNINLNRITIESMRTEVHKGSRIKSQIVLNLEVSTTEELPTVTLDRHASFAVKDSKGRTYPIETIKPTIISLSAETQSITITANGSPRWWGVKSIELTIKPGTLAVSYTHLTLPTIYSV